MSNDRLSRPPLSQPLLICICGPGGCGKSTICRELAARHPSTLTLSISTTTRAPRGNEIDGREYHFVSDAAFEKLVQAGEFLEYATFGKHRYGTARTNLQEATATDRDLLLDIDMQGAEQLRKSSTNVVVTFVFPPSFKVLTSRLQSRKTESKEQISERLDIAEREIAVLSDPAFSDYFVINDKLEECVLEVEHIIEAEHLRLKRLDSKAVKAVLARS